MTNERPSDETKDDQACEMKIGPKTIEEIYREHTDRVEKGIKEEWSAWRFAKAVGEILDRPADCIQSDEYETGTDCDKTVFRDGFLRCHDLLVKLVDGSCPMGFRDDGVVIPLELWKDVLREVQSA